MPLDQQLLDFDSRGIFPQEGETEQRYTNRANLILETAWLSRYPHILERYKKVFRDQRGCPDLHPPEFWIQNHINTVIRKFRNRFATDLSWVPVYRGFMGDYWHETGSVGATAQLHGRNFGKEGSPIVVLSTLIETRWGIRRTLRHEYVHTMRIMAMNLDDIPDDWEEKIAWYGTSRFKGWLEEPHLRKEFGVVRRRLRQVFGGMRNYAFIRLPAKTQHGIYVNKVSADRLRTFVCEEAEKGDLRYRIMKEKTGL